MWANGKRNKKRGDGGAHQLLEGLDALERPHRLEQLRRQATALPTTHVLPTLRHNHNPAAWCCLVLILR